MTVRRDRLFGDPAEKHGSSALVYDIANSVSISDVGINGIIDDMIFSDFLSSDSEPTYVRYVCGTWFKLKYVTGIPLLRMITVEDPRTRNLGDTLVDDQMVYSLSKTDVQLMLQAKNCFVKNPSKKSSFHSFFSHQVCAYLFPFRIRTTFNL